MRQRGEERFPWFAYRAKEGRELRSRVAARSFRRCEMDAGTQPEQSPARWPSAKPSTSSPRVLWEVGLRRMQRLALAALLASIWASVAGIAPQADSLRQLRFSPDGRYILAQDSSGIAVLAVSPLAILFRIRAELAGDAQFTPDSLQIMFVSSLARADRHPAAEGQRILLVRSAPHMERWRVADGTRVEWTEIKGLNCATEQLSLDGRILACNDPEGTLRIVDIASGETLLEKKQFVKLLPLYSFTAYGIQDLPNGHFLGDLRKACFDYSPGGRLLKADPCGCTGKVLVYDLHDRAVLGLARRITRHASVFVTEGKLLTVNGPYRAKQHVIIAKLVAFPSGKMLARPRIPPFELSRATEPGVVISRPNAATRKYDPHVPTSAVELSTGRVIVSHTPALDVLGRYYVAEPSAGTVGLYERGRGLQATVALYNK